MAPANRVLTGVVVLLLILAFLFLTGCSGRIGVMAWEGEVDAQSIVDAVEAGSVPVPIGSMDADDEGHGAGLSAQGCMVHLHDVAPDAITFEFETTDNGVPSCTVNMGQ